MHSYSTHHALLYAVVKAANIYEPMRLRRTEDGVSLHDAIDIGCSVMQRGTKAFVFAYYPWVEGESVTDFIFPLNKSLCKRQAFPLRIGRSAPI